MEFVRKNDWPKVTVEEVASDVTVGHVGPMADEYVDSGVPFLRSLSVERFGIRQEGMKFISPDFHAKLKKSALVPGDVVIVRTGKPGTCAVIPDWLTNANCSDLVIVRCGPRVRPHFLCYIVNSVAGDHIDSHTVGAVQQHFNVSSARTLSFFLPPLDEQDRILALLRGLDDKIELNRKMNATLEAMARALFRDWFVDFGPTRAKMAGAAPYLSPDLWSLFPDRLDAEGKPEGWEVRSIYDFANVVYGAPFASKQFNTDSAGIPLIRIRDLATHEPGVWTEEVHPKGHLIEPGDIVVGMDGEFRLHVWKGAPAWLNQRVCHFEPRPGVPTAFLAEILIEPLAFFERGKVGTTVIHLGKGDIDTFRLLHPGTELLSAFGEIAGSLIDATVKNATESRTLAQTRDLLLPRLMSGELRLAEVERIAEAVL